MLISFTGAQSTGKTTLIDKMLNSHEFEDWNYVDEVTRLVKREYNVDINEHGDDDTQLMIMCQHIKNLTEHKYNESQGSLHTALDRCVVDGLLYSKYLHSLGRIDFSTLDICDSIYRNTIDRLDIIFYTDPTDVLLHDDGERSVDPEFRNSIIELYDEWLESPPGNVVKLSGDVTARFNRIVTEINKFNI